MTRSILSLMLAVAPRPSQVDDKTLTIKTNCQLFSVEDTVEQHSRAYFENLPVLMTTWWEWLLSTHLLLI